MIVTKQHECNVYMDILKGENFNVNIGTREYHAWITFVFWLVVNDDISTERSFYLVNETTILSLVFRYHQHGALNNLYACAGANE